MSTVLSLMWAFFFACVTGVSYNDKVKKKLSRIVNSITKMDPSFSNQNDRSYRDIEWSSRGLGNRETSSQQHQANGSNKTSRVPRAMDFGSEYHYGPGGHQASEVNELFAEEQVLKFGINYVFLMSAFW